MTVKDIAFNDGAFTYTHSRKYDNLGNVQDDGPNGFGWQSKSVPRIVRHSVFWRVEFADNDSVHFPLQPDSSNVYVALQGFPETMQIDEVNKTIQVIRSNQSVWIFNNDPNNKAPVGALLSVVATDGNITEFVYDNSARLEKIQGYHNTQPSQILGVLEYTWDSASRISSIMHKQWDGSAIQSIRRVSYAYHTGADSFGNLGDLKTVTTEVASGGNWITGETYYYRYYKSGDPKGKKHMLKMAFFPEEFRYFAETFGTTACFSVADSIALDFSKKYYEYDSDGRVVLEKVDQNSKTISLEYTEYPETNDANAVHRKTVETGAHGEQNIVFTNFKGDVLLKEHKPPQGAGEESAIHYRIFNANRKQIYRYHPKAIKSYTVVPGTPTTLKVSFSFDEGMIEINGYHPEAKDKIARKFIQHGISGTSIIQSEYTYEKRQVGASVAWNITQLTQYEDEANAKPIVTQFAYTYHPNSMQIEQKTTIYPAVSISQNGNGIATTRVDRYDAKGRQVWAKDELGIITYRQYNPVTGSLVKSIQDVNTMQVADFTTPVPNGWATVSAAGKHLVTEYTHDSQGRVTQTLGPRNSAINDANQPIEVRPVSWTVYDDANFTVKSASGFATMNGNNITSFTLVNPVSITIRNAEGNVLEQIRATRTSASGKLLANDTFVQSSYTAWTKNIYQGGRLTATRQYHLIPASGDGVKNTNFLETTFGYDTFGRQNKTVSPDGTITTTDFDWMDNPVKTWVGTTDQNLIVVNETEYGDSGVCSCCTGQKNKPRVAIQHVDGSTMRITEFGYDWRGRTIFIFGEEDADGNITYAKQTYDNLNRVVKSEHFLLVENAGTTLPTGSERLAVLHNDLNDDILLARVEQFYDVRDRVWKIEQSVVNPGNAHQQGGAVQGKLLGQSWYDAAGRVLKQIGPGANHFTKFAYDSLGRVTKTYLATNPSESGYAAASSLTNNTVLTQSETTFDNLGNTILQTQLERLSTAVGTGALTLSTGRYKAVASWYDGAGRSTATANYGTNNRLVAQPYATFSAFSIAQTSFVRNRWLCRRFR